MKLVRASELSSEVWDIAYEALVELLTPELKKTRFFDCTRSHKDVMIYHLAEDLDLLFGSEKGELVITAEQIKEAREYF